MIINNREGTVSANTKKKLWRYGYRQQYFKVLWNLQF